MCASLWLSFWRGIGTVQVDCPLRSFAKISGLDVPSEVCYAVFLFPGFWSEQPEILATMQTGNGFKFDLAPIDGNQTKFSKVKDTGSHKLIITGQAERRA